MTRAPTILFRRLLRLVAGIDRDGEIYRMRLDGTIRQVGRAGKLPKEFEMVNAIDCRGEGGNRVSARGSI